MPADPRPGTYHAQEVAPGVAEDYANIVVRGERITVPYGTFTDTLRGAATRRAAAAVRTRASGSHSRASS
jgi:hypothetical protein